MPFDNGLSQDASLQQGEYLELWEGSRFKQRQDPLPGDHAGNYPINRLVKDGNEQNVDMPRRHELVAHLPKDEDEEKDKSNNDSLTEVRHCLQNQESSIIKVGGPSTWLSSALLRQQNQSLDDRENVGQVNAEKWCPVCSANGPQSCMCNSSAHIPGDSDATSFLHQSTYTHWLSMQGTGIHGSSSQQRPAREFDGKDDEYGVDRQQIRLATELNLSAAYGRDAQPYLESLSRPSVGGSRYAGEYSRADWDGARQEAEWEDAKMRFLITSHPLYAEMLSIHAACLRVGTPVDQLPSIDEQLLQAPTIIEKYSVLRDQIAEISKEEQVDLDRFMTDYTDTLRRFRVIFQNHVYSDVTEAMMACWDLEQALLNLTGARPDKGQGLTMSDEDFEEYDSDHGSYEHCMSDYNDSGGYGPLVPTETERNLMERVRQELKHELKQGYKSKIEDVREEILRKRRAGKLPEGTTTVLKAWWQAHSKWPYPTEDEKELLIQETGLELKQVNNWFINQRKRNWHANPLASSQSDSKSKARKSW